MLIGPLSEWVSAIAEILAVCVALFLPYLTAYRASKSRRKKFVTSIAHLTGEALDGNDRSRKELSSFLNVGFLISNNDKEQDVIRTGMQILNLLDEPITDTNKSEIHRLLSGMK